MTKPVPGAKRGRPPGFVGSANRTIEYVCSACRNEFTKEDLFAKRVIYSHVGRNTKIIRSRTTAWLCEACMNADPDYARDGYASSPGMKGTRIAAGTD